jgi:hypothetical protein
MGLHYLMRMDNMDKKTYESLSAGIFLIGLGLLFLTHIGFWPWILVVIGAAGLPASLAHQRGWYGWQGFFWMLGLAILFWSGFFWPGILILVGVSMLFGAATRESEGSPFASQPMHPEDRPKQEPFAVDERKSE